MDAFRPDKVSYRLSPLLLHRVFLFVSILNVIYLFFRVLFVGEVAEELDEEGRARILHGTFHIIHMSHMLLWMLFAVAGYVTLPRLLKRDDKLQEFHYVCNAFTLRICYEWIQEVSVGKLRYVNIQTGMYPITFWLNIRDGPDEFLDDARALLARGHGDESQGQDRVSKLASVLKKSNSSVGKTPSINARPSVRFNPQSEEHRFEALRSLDTAITASNDTSMMGGISSAGYDSLALQAPRLVLPGPGAGASASSNQ